MVTVAEMAGAMVAVTAVAMEGTKVAIPATLACEIPTDRLLPDQAIIEQTQ